MKKLYFGMIVSLLLCSIGVSRATTYYFSGAEDIRYENPANWSPSYPGFEIGANDCVVFLSEATFSGSDLHIKGKCFVEVGIQLTSKTEGVVVYKNAALHNEGEIYVNFLHNQGAFWNGIEGWVRMNQYQASQAAFLRNSNKEKDSFLFDTKKESYKPSRPEKSIMDINYFDYLGLIDENSLYPLNK